MKRSATARRAASLSHRQRRSCLPVAGILIVLVVAVVGAAQVAYWIALAGRDSINILVLGLDRRQQETGPSRSDVIMLIHLDAHEERVRLLSIPRDLYVEIPDHGQGRINTAHFWGELETAGGGPARVVQVINQNFGLPVHGYFRFDFQGFVKVVDALGGIYVEVPSDIHDNDFPTDDFGYMSLAIPAGRQKMDGEMALAYVRTRHGSSDFDRVRRQQQVTEALLRRAASPPGWLCLPAALKAVQASVDTDLRLDKVLFWALFAVRSDLDPQDSIVLDETMTFPWTTEQGSQVLLPDWNRILPLMRRFGGG